MSLPHTMWKRGHRLPEGLPDRSVGLERQGRRRVTWTLQWGQIRNPRGFPSVGAAAGVGSLTGTCKVQRHKGVKVPPSGLTVCRVEGRQRAGKQRSSIMGSDEVGQTMEKLGSNRGCCRWGRIAYQTREIGQGVFEQRHEGQEVIRASASAETTALAKVGHGGRMCLGFPPGKTGSQVTKETEEGA